MTQPPSAPPANSVLGKKPTRGQECFGHTLGQEGLKRHQAVSSSKHTYSGGLGGAPTLCSPRWIHLALQGVGLQEAEPGMVPGQLHIQPKKSGQPPGEVDRYRQPPGKVDKCS